MATVNEQNLQGKDALASIETAAVISAGDRFTGDLDGKRDEDWIRIQLDGGKTYTFTLKGDGSATQATDTILMLLDSKGGMIAKNDDVDAPNGDLTSELEVRIETSGTYYISASSYAGNPNLDASGNYVLTVRQLGLTVDLTGTEKADKLYGTSRGESIFGGKGNDLLDGGGGDDDLDGGVDDDLLIGGPGADSLDGGPGDDTISYSTSMKGVSINLRSGSARGGDAEGDTLANVENVEGSGNDDSLSGGKGKNSLWGLAGDDTLKGDRGDDKLYGGAGADDLDGGDGDDVLEGGPGADELTGGDDADTASYAGSAAAVTVRLHASQAMGGDAEGDTWGDTVTKEYSLPDEDDEMVDYKETVPDIVSLTGSAHNDTLAGDSRANTLMGLGGDDRLYGGPGGGNDKMYGGDGDDRLYGGHGDDDLYGGKGDDILVGGPDDDEFYGGFGNDTIYADKEDDMVDGWYKATDTERPKNDPNTSANETMESVSDPNSMDTLSYEKLKLKNRGIGTNSEWLTLGEDDGTNNATIINIENLIGTDEDDYLKGNSEDNVIEGRDGADKLDGDGGDDTVSYEHSDRRVTIVLGDTAETQTAKGGHAQGDDIKNFENVIGSKYDDTLEGGSANNTLMGGPGADRLTGGDGDDVLQGGPGADELDGDQGRETGQTRSANDTLSYAGSSAGVRVSLASASASGGDAEGDEIEVERDAYDPDGAGDDDPVDVATLENVTGSDHNDRLTGDHRDNVLKGGAGDDILRGGASNPDDDGNGTYEPAELVGDTLIGGPGADELDGGEDAREKNDRIPAREAVDLNGDGDKVDEGELAITEGPASMDIASYAGASAGITLDLDAGRGTRGDARGDTLISIEKVVGSSYDDVFIASEGVDIIDGGNETDMKEKDGDTVSYELSFEPVTVDLTQTTQSDANLSPDSNDEESFAKDDVLTNIENVIGSAYNDKLTGNSVVDDGTTTNVNEAETTANTLMGGAGRDTLTGGAGDDTLLGGTDRDTLTGGDGKDMLDGGAGADTLKGDGGADTLIGGSGDDDLYGGGNDDAIDIFVFSPKDGRGNDIIIEFQTDEDRIDLSAFNLRPSDLVPLIEARGSTNSYRIEIDLTGHGGGRIELRGLNDIDALEVSGGTKEDEIETLSVWTDDDGDNDSTDGDGNGVVDTGEAGIFIL